MSLSYHEYRLDIPTLTSCEAGFHINFWHTVLGAIYTCLWSGLASPTAAMSAQWPG